MRFIIAKSALILLFPNQDSSQFVEPLAVEVLAVFENVDIRIREGGTVFRQVGEIDHRIVFRVPQVDVGHVFRHVRHVSRNFERPALFERSRD